MKNSYKLLTLLPLFTVPDVSNASTSTSTINSDFERVYSGRTMTHISIDYSSIDLPKKGVASITAPFSAQEIEAIYKGQALYNQGRLRKNVWESLDDQQRSASIKMDMLLYIGQQAKNLEESCLKRGKCSKG